VARDAKRMIDMMY